MRVRSITRGSLQREEKPKTVTMLDSLIHHDAGWDFRAGLVARAVITGWAFGIARGTTSEHCGPLVLSFACQSGGKYDEESTGLGNGCWARGPAPRLTPPYLR